MSLSHPNIVFGRTPGVLGAGGGGPGELDWMEDRTDADPLKKSGSKVLIIEPRAVRAHTQYGVRLYRCSNPAFHKDVVYQRVRQGNLYNCPLPAILAAMAHTGIHGRIKIATINRPAYSKQGDKEIKVDRYFSVEFPGKAKGGKIRKALVTDFFYGKGTCQFEYAHSHPYHVSEKELWVSLSEKAFVRTNAGNTYERVNDPDNPTAAGPDIYEYFQTLVGNTAKWVDVAAADDKDLQQLIAKATTTPMISNLPGATGQQAHAYMLEGLDSHTGDVNVWDALNGRGWPLTLKEFKSDFQYIFYE